MDRLLLSISLRASLGHGSANAPASGQHSETGTTGWRRGGEKCHEGKDLSRSGHAHSPGRRSETALVWKPCAVHHQLPFPDQTGICQLWREVPSVSASQCCQRQHSLGSHMSPVRCSFALISVPCGAKHLRRLSLALGEACSRTDGDLALRNSYFTPMQTSPCSLRGACSATRDPCDPERLFVPPLHPGDAGRARRVQESGIRE